MNVIASTKLQASKHVEQPQEGNLYTRKHQAREFTYEKEMASTVHYDTVHQRAWTHWIIVNRIHGWSL